jgi:hypothetical protein
MAKSFYGWLPMWFNTKLKKEKQPSRYDKKFQLFFEKMARKMPQITFFPRFSGRNVNQKEIFHGSSY